jgi:uncharacterized protein (TIGR03545 family)
MTTSNATPKTNKQSFVRWNALIPFLCLCILGTLYFHFLFDGQLRRTIEWTGYKALGAEVNIASLKTSFFDASIQIEGIELTDTEKPTQNSIKIGSIRFGMLWDAFLRLKFVINEATMEQIEFGSPRNQPGKVAPPPPISKEPGMLSTLGEKVKNEAQKEIESRYEDNVLGDIVSLLSSSDKNAALQNLTATLPSKAMIERFQKNLDEKQKAWDLQLKSLPQGQEIQALSDRLNKIQTKDFKNPQELTTALQQLQSLFQDADSKYKKIESLKTDFDKDLKSLQTEYGQIEKQVKIDTGDLEKRFKIPKLDAKALTLAIFNRYLAPYRAKFFKYQTLAEKYLPPKFLHKTASDENTIQAHPREKGMTYEFSRKNSYPMFWVKRISISSKAQTDGNYGNIKGEVTNITSNQVLVGQPTKAHLAGDFPNKGIFGLLLDISLDNRPSESLIQYLFKIDSYNIAGKVLVNSEEVNIGFNKAQGSMKLDGSLTGFKKLVVAFDNQFTKIDYSIGTNNETATQILKSIFNGIPSIHLMASAQGEFPNIPLSVESSLGTDLQKGFQREIQAKISEAQKKIQIYIDQEIGKQKAQVDGQLDKLRLTIQNEVNKAQGQLDEQKKKAESKVNLAKKDSENQGRKKLETEGKKALDDLKKQLGF